MTEHVWIIDGMLSGTGVRDGIAGGYLDLSELGISGELGDRLSRWVAEYENAHYYQFNDAAKNDDLDKEGVAIARQVQQEVSGITVQYFSNARLRKLAI